MNKKSILAIDDMVPNLSIIRTVMEDFFNVYLAKSTETASVILKNTKIDLILLDIEMPEMSGFDYLKCLQNMPSCGNIPVIFITSHSTGDFITRIKNSGAKDFIVKPISAPVLLEKVSTALAG
jgi:putative two-component system response regulator